ncbi:MAG TPA: FliM/FliN family flagellar motor switch protein [Acidobacteriaceae bacterium]|nr:FliM/FliN family flagellar motor switch protein [Terriglobia bacterium]HVC91218.1 FliM/FliN family flagellar motor switch protein [Acidobacteriaceae bacterium]
MDKPLAQEEIDALFAAARSRGSSVKERPASERVQPFTFSRGGQINNEQMRAISLLNDNFARNLTHNLGAFLRSRFQVALAAAEQPPYSEFIERIPEICYVGSIRLEPLGAICGLELDLTLALSMIDLLLGGEGQSTAVRELTDIEESILASVLEVVCRELTSAWQPVGLTFNFEKRQQQTQIARLMSPTEKTLSISFEIRMPHVQGNLNLVFPAVVSNTVLRRLITGWGRQNRRRSPEMLARMEERLQHVRFRGALQLPSVRILATELDALQPGSIVRLNLPATSVSELCIAGIPLFHAIPIRADEHRGLQITARNNPLMNRTVD